jgi:transmembrane sensor
MSRSEFTYLVPLITESRLARQYDAVRARMPAPRRPGRAWVGWVVAAASTAALAIVLWRAGSVRKSGLVDEAVLESGSTADGVRVTLADGSSLQLAAATRARLTSAQPKAIRIDLDRGAVEIEATHVDGRSFVVGAGLYEVRVVGTHFAVQRDPGDQVVVRVDRGAVEVASTAGGNAGETRRLAAGERWSASDGVAGQPSGSTPAGEPAQVDTATPVPFRPAAAEPPQPGPATTANAALAHHDETARELFDDAQRARADGRSDDAARAFDRLRRTFPHDPRSALAAFELGRLRLDVLGDPRGAEEALRDAIALGPSSPFREDAEARRVEALWRMGDSSTCASARAAYLARWPNGTYRRAVEVGCGGR